jgi:hypothetical protein
MTQSASASRRRLHRRTFECEGYVREDRLYEIEGTITDVRDEPQVNRWRGTLPGGQPLHRMTARLVIDRDWRLIDIAIATDAAPYPGLCETIAPDYRRLIGCSIAKGWMRRVAEVMGGTAGCTHINELLGRLGTVAYLTIYLDEQREADAGRPLFIDGCHALAEDGQAVALEFPNFARPTDC